MRDAGSLVRRAGALTTALAAALLAAGCQSGEVGPMGPPGPPGESVRGASYAAHFDRAADLDTWVYGTAGEWEVDGGRLVLTAGAGERALVGPSSSFAGDLDVSVQGQWTSAGPGAAFGLRFCAGPRGAYALTLSEDGTYSLWREDGGGEAVPVIPPSGDARLQREASIEVRAVVRGVAVAVYLGGTLVARREDAGPREGQVQVFVDGPGQVAFDDLWVNVAMPLLKTAAP